MLTDIQATLSDEQAFTGTGDTTNYYDAGEPYDWSRGEPMGVLFTVDVAAAFTGDEAYVFTVNTSNDPAFATATELGVKTVDAADLQAGDKVVVPFHIGAEQYVQGSLTLTGTSPSITITAEVKPLCDIATETSDLPSGYTVTV